jgi:hypothetical protein
MRKPLMSVVMIALALAVASHGQVASSPNQLVHPILRDPNKRNAPTSLNRDPSLAQDPSDSLNQASNRSRTMPSATKPGQPALTEPKIDSGLAASKLALMGTVSGIRGTLYVTNSTSHEITPVVQLIVCDDKGIKIGLVSKTGTALPSNADEKIVVLATNVNATDLKLMRLTSVGAK